MEPNEFATFIESLYNADDTSGSAIGYEYPNLGPPEGDEVAVEGYKAGLELRKRLK